MPIGRDDYEERKERKIEVLKDKALKAAEIAEQQGRKAHGMADAIPFGQPVLAGHHSEKRHRADLKRIEGAYQKSYEAGKKAAYYQDRADTVAENRSISGDNPDAVNLYKEKLAKLEALQEYMKAVNKAFAKGDEALKALGLTDEDIAKIKSNMLSYEKKPYPAWALGNNSAEIRRVKEKMESLEKLDSMAAENIKFSGGEMIVGIEINRVQFIFDDKPSEAVRSLLKSHGFKWAPSQNAWQRQRTENAVRAARSLVSKITGAKQ